MIVTEEKSHIFQCNHLLIQPGPLRDKISCIKYNKLFVISECVSIKKYASEVSERVV